MFWSLLLACTQAPQEPAAKTDIVLVVVDTLRADHLGVYGHKRPTSPIMDQLAEDGTWFHRAYAQSGWTLPSMASLMSGLYAHQHLVGR
ncbi:MAG: sulfatase-like hydrolase/transferase, partial [Myxococcota bacterium]